MGKTKSYSVTFTDPTGKIVKTKIFKAKNLSEAKRQAQLFKKNISYKGPGRLRTGIIIIDN
jgi:hypothetical protein